LKTSENLWIRVSLTLLLAVCAGFFATHARFYEEALIDGFFSLALASVLILHLRVRPKWSDALFVLAGVALCAAVDFKILGYTPRPMVWFSFIGLSSFLVLAIRTVWAEASERRMLLYAGVPALLFVISEYFASDMLAWTSAAHPKTLDLYLLSFDCSLRIQFSFLVGQMFQRHSWLYVPSLLVYLGLAIPIALVYAGKLVREKERAFPIMLAFLVTGPVGILFYNLFPACGPRYLFLQGFPFHVFPIDQAPRLLLEPIAIEGARNAMPSLHMAWTLLAWWYSRGLSWWERSIALFFLAFTVLGTLGLGEHWFLDLVVAFPFALMILAACAYNLTWNAPARVSAFLFGLMCTLAWFVALRHAPRLFWASPVIPWSLIIATISVAIYLQTKLDRVAAIEPAAEARERRPAPAIVEAHG
jgi:hypothetical protein